MEIGEVYSLCQEGRLSLTKRNVEGEMQLDKRGAESAGQITGILT